MIKNLPKILLISMIILFSIAGLCLLFLLTGHLLNARSPLPELMFAYAPYILILAGLIAFIWRIILIKNTLVIKWISFGFVILTILFLLAGTIRSEYSDATPLSDYYLVLFLGSLFAVIVMFIKPENNLLYKISASVLLCFELFIMVFLIRNLTNGAFHLSFIIILLSFVFPVLYYIKFHTIVWMKWVSFGVLILSELYYFVILIFYRSYNLITPNSIFLLFLCIFALVLDLILFIPNHRWTRFVLAFYSLIVILTLSGFSIAGLTKVHDTYTLYYKDIRLMMQQRDHKNRKVVYQEDTQKRLGNREVYIEEKFLIFRVEKEIQNAILTGVWYEYDESGNFLKLRVYASDGTLTFAGNIDENKVIYPETKEKLFEALNNAVPEQRIELNGEYVIDSDLEITGKNNIFITPLLITQIKGTSQEPVIKNPETTRGGLILKNCENVTIDGLTLMLTNETAHYPGIISLYKCTNVAIQYCVIQGKAEYGIYIHDSCSNIQVRSNKIEGYRQYGCFTDYGSNIFENNYYANSNKLHVENMRFTKNDFMNVYENSFDSAYTSMYDGNYYTPINFPAYTLGMYMGTPGNIQYDSGMYLASTNFFGSKGLMDLNDDFFTFLLEQISGIPVYVPDEKRDHESPWYLDETVMPYYNPEFIRWAGNNLLPDPGDGIPGFTYQQLYNHCYQRFFRVLAETYMYIQNTLDIQSAMGLFLDSVKNEGTPKYHLKSYYSYITLDTDSLVLQYSYPDMGLMGVYDDYPGYEGYDETAPSEGENGGYDDAAPSEGENGGYDDAAPSEGANEVYDEGYSGMFPEYGMTGGDYDPYQMFGIELDYVLTPPNAIGFWFRRYIDTSCDEVWEVLKNLFSKYDPDWYYEKGMANY